MSPGEPLVKQEKFLGEYLEEFLEHLKVLDIEGVCCSQARRIQTV
jgi:hypothetical protein